MSVNVLSVRVITHRIVVNVIAVIEPIQRLSLTQATKLCWPWSPNCSLAVTEAGGGSDTGVRCKKYKFDMTMSALRSRRECEYIGDRWLKTSVLISNFIKGTYRNNGTDHEKSLQVRQ